MKECHFPLSRLISPHGEISTGNPHMSAYQTHIQTIEWALLDLLKQVPGISIGPISSSSNHPLLLSSDINIDRADQIHGFEAPLTTASGEQWTIIVLTRANGEPRLIRESCARLTSIINTSPMRDKLYPVVAANYISRRATLICQAMNVGYLDLSGNCHISFDSISSSGKFLKTRTSKNARCVISSLPNPAGSCGCSWKIRIAAGRYRLCPRALR